MKRNPYKTGDAIFWIYTEGGGGGSGHRANVKRARPGFVLNTSAKTCVISTDTGRTTRVRFGSLAMRARGTT